MLALNLREANGLRAGHAVRIGEGGSTCKVFGACRGGCWAENKAATGSLAAPPREHCGYNLAFFNGIVEPRYL